MNCPQCGGALPQGANLCPECGAPSSQARFANSTQGFEAEIQVMLAEANLSRMRGRYDRATAQCVEVLRRYPNNVSAHSLLGDIYRDQGQDADAIGWYRLAIQLDPTSAADHDKLADAMARLARPRQEQDSSASGSRRRRLRAPVGLVLGVAIGLMVLATLVALSVSRGEERPGVLNGINMPRVMTPAAEPPRAAAQPPSPAHRPPAPAHAPVVYTPGAPTLPPAPANYANRGHRLLTCVAQAAETEQLMIAVDSVAVDPRADTAQIEITARDVSASPKSREDILRKSLRAAELVLMCDDKIERVTVRCKAPLQGPGGIQEEQLFFVGDVSATTLRQAAGRNLTFAEALELFHSPWWHDPVAAQP